MKRTLTGLALLALAGLILFKDYLKLPDIGMPWWLLLLTVVLAIDALQNLVHKHFLSSLCEAVVIFALLNQHFHWLKVSLGAIVLASVLAFCGCSLIFKNQRPRYYRSRDGKAKMVGWTNDPDMAAVHTQGADTVFAAKTRYINDAAFTNVSGDMVFSSNAVYFDNAMMAGTTATYSGDTVFSSLRLYVPKNWAVEVSGDTVLSAIDVKPSGYTTDKTLIITGDVVLSRINVYYL